MTNKPFLRELLRVNKENIHLVLQDEKGIIHRLKLTPESILSMVWLAAWLPNHFDSLDATSLSSLKVAMEHVKKAQL